MVDRLDAKILNLVQNNNRLTVEQIGAEVGLSASGCQRRLSKLRETGVIRADVSIVDPASVDKHLTLLIDVTLAREDTSSFTAFKQAMRANPNVMQCYYVTGDKDFLLIICVKDMAEFESFLNEFCIDNPAISRFSSSVVVDSVKAGLAINVKASP